MPTGKHITRGFTYIGILIAVAILGVVLATTGIVWHTAQQRDREQQLLYVGAQFRTAIGRYVKASSHIRQYPASLNDLLRDPRSPAVVRYLRKIYYDPMTGSRDWGLIKDVNGRIMGVFSKSKQHPIKQTNFNQEDREFEGKDAYSDWIFIYRPKFRRAVRRPHTNPAAPLPFTSGPSISSGKR